jgi:uncharacterized protein YndB with AHSA1/START domain
VVTVAETQESTRTRTIEQTVVIAAAPDVVYSALTDARELVRWFPTKAESDPRPGGAFKFTFLNEQDRNADHVREGRYLDATPGRSVRYPWHMSADDPGTAVEFRLEPQGRATRVTLTHSGWGVGSEWDKAVEMHTRGWAFFLQNLRSFLEEGKDSRASALGMKTSG